MFHQTLVTDDGLVRYGSSKIVNGAAAREHLPGGSFQGTNRLADRSDGQVQQQGDIRIAENGMLLVGLFEEAPDAPLPKAIPSPAGLGLIDVLWGDQIQDHWTQFVVLDALVAGRWDIGGDP